MLIQDLAGGVVERRGPPRPHPPPPLVFVQDPLIQEGLNEGDEKKKGWPSCGAEPRRRECRANAAARCRHAAALSGSTGMRGPQLQVQEPLGRGGGDISASPPAAPSPGAGDGQAGLPLRNEYQTDRGSLHCMFEHQHQRPLGAYAVQQAPAPSRSTRRFPRILEFGAHAPGGGRSSRGGQLDKPGGRVLLQQRHRAPGPARLAQSLQDRQSRLRPCRRIAQAPSYGSVVRNVRHRGDRRARPPAYAAVPSDCWRPAGSTASARRAGARTREGPPRPRAGR